MANSIVEDEIYAALTACREKIEFGSTEVNALNFATIVYQQRHPCVLAGKARAIVGEAIGLES